MKTRSTAKSNKAYLDVNGNRLARYQVPGKGKKQVLIRIIPVRVQQQKAKQIKNTRKRAPPQQRIDIISYHNMRKYLWIKTKILIKYYMLLS